MPNLYIRYGDIVLHDDDVDELDFTDAPGRVAVTGRLSAPKPAASAGAGLLDLLAGARKAQTQKIVDEKRRELDDDVKIPQHAAEVTDND